VFRSRSASAFFRSIEQIIVLERRMEESAPIGGLRISHATYRHMRGLFDVAEEAPMVVKGIDEPIRTYIVQRAKPRTFRVTPRGIEGVDTRMVGRESEMAKLSATIPVAVPAVTVTPVIAVSSVVPVPAVIAASTVVAVGTSIPPRHDHAAAQHGRQEHSDCNGFHPSPPGQCAVGQCRGHGVPSEL
jgi:hypothetical protein